MSALCKSRLKKEQKKIQKEKNEYFSAIPLRNDIRTWHYVIIGPKDTPYFGGYYHGVLKFPRDYPYKPPSILMFTPNGRFQINTKLCMSNSDYHPESWSPFWSVSNILTGFVSFMCENKPGLGSMKTSSAQRKSLARQSLTFNMRNAQFVQLFPKHVQLFKERKRNGFKIQKEEEIPNEISSQKNGRKHKKKRDWMF